MKKKTMMLLLLACLLAVCSAQAFAGEAETCAPDGSVIFEKDGLKVTTAGLDLDPTTENTEPILWLEIENTGTEDAYLGVADSSFNGVTVPAYLIEFYVEDGEYFGGDYEFQLTIPAGSHGRYALGIQNTRIPGIPMDTIQEAEFRFTLAEDEYSWPDYLSAPVKIVTGEAVEPIDLEALGTVVLDNEQMTLVIGPQDYDDWFGPYVYIYLRNKTDSYLGLVADLAEADGNSCDYIFYSSAVAPGKCGAGSMMFDVPISDLKGFEELSISFRLSQAATEEELDLPGGTPLDPVRVTYPPQVWGEYEFGGLRLAVQPKYNDLITVETSADSPDGILFSASETASLEAGGHEGAGWLFSIGTVDEARLREMLCSDMSGATVFAMDEAGRYYIYYHPTDVRYERATPEEMQRDQDQWSMLCEWAASVPDSIAEANGLERVSYGNSEIDMAVARAAWQKDAQATLSTLEYGSVDAQGIDATPYAEFILQGWFMPVDSKETPDGEYVVLSFPEEDMQLDFFFAPGGYVRLVSGENKTLYQSAWVDDAMSYAEVMQGWYYAAAEHAGLREADDRLAGFCGTWAEKIAGRGRIEITESIAPGKCGIEVNWANSAFAMTSWTMVARLEQDGLLHYENGIRSVTETDEDGVSWIIDESWGESGTFALTEAGELSWHDDAADRDGDSLFLRQN